MWERFWQKVRKDPTGCWLWTGALSKGYGVIGLKEGEAWRAKKAYKLLYVHLYGKPAKNLVVDHICKNTLCVNPKHLQAITQKENVLRGKSIPAHNARKLYCKYGHRFTKENIILLHKKDGTRRLCRKCNSNQCKINYKKRHSNFRLTT